MLRIPNCEYTLTSIYQDFNFFFGKKSGFLHFFFHSGNSEDDNKNLMTQKTTCPVEESSNLESEKSYGADQTSKNEADLPDTSLSPKDAKVEIDAKTDGNTTDTAGTESKQSEGVIALEKTPEKTLLDQPEAGQVASQCCSGTSNPEDSPEKDSDVQTQPEGTIKAQPEQDIALLPVCLLKTY